MPALTFAPGTTIGRYQILGQLGMGGMATVYRAFQPSLDREVALKLLRPGLSEDPTLSERFEREAKAIARLRHPNIVQVFDFEVTPSGELVLAMELLDGGTLKLRQVQLAAQGRRLDPAEAVRIVWEVADALTYAHEAGIVHRDVKPSNVMLAKPRDRAVVTDFGIARILGETTSTLTGVGIGTPAYMAPEQGQGTAVDRRADIYSLGAVAYELLVGRVPYKADTPLAVVLAHMRDPLPLPSTVEPSIGPGVEKALLKALAKDPAARFDTAVAFAEALKSGLADDARRGAISTAAPPRVVTVPTARLSRRVLLGAGGGLVAVFASGIVAANALRPPQATPAPTAQRTAIATPAERTAIATPAQRTATTAPTPALSPTPSPKAPKFAVPAKGALIWEARLDGTANDFGAVQGGGPQPNLPILRPSIGAVEVAITRADTSGGIIPRGLAIPDRDRYVAEMDLSFDKADLTFVWQLRRPSIGLGMGLLVTPAFGIGAYAWQPQFQALAAETPIPGLDGGRQFTVAVAAAHPRYEVYVDGKRVFEFTSTDPSGTAVPLLGVEGNAGSARITRLQYYSAP